MIGSDAPQNTVYLTGIDPENARRIRDDFRDYPFPGWQLEELEVGAMPPVGLLAGRAILVIGFGDGAAPGYTEAMWLLRLLACGCPWVAVAEDPEWPTREMCEAAGASAYLAHPYSPAMLREVLWFRAVPHAGRIAPPPLYCDLVIRYLSALGADVMLKFSADGNRTGFLALRGGKLVYANVIDGANGWDGFCDIISWGKGKVLGQRLPPNLRANVTAEPSEWLRALRSSPVQSAAVAPGGQSACDVILGGLSDVSLCALIDYHSGRVVALPSNTPPDAIGGGDLLSAASDLLRAKFLLIGPAGAHESPEEVVIMGRDAWLAATRLGHESLALVVGANGRAQLGLARPLFAEAARELDAHGGLTVIPVESGPVETASGLRLSPPVAGNGSS